MQGVVHRTVCGCIATAVTGCALLASAQELQVTQVNLPTVKFFYYSADDVEWALSAESERLQQHLAANPQSHALFEAVSASVTDPPAAEESAKQMTRWIESERSRFEQTRREAVRIRMAEGIIAYLRAHDFSISNLVEALKRRSGAVDVEVVAVHLRDEQSESSFQLKIILVNPDIEIGKQGFNVNLRSPNVSYAAVTYALGVALYEVHDLLNGDTPEEGESGQEEIEPLPLPEPLDGPALDTTQARVS